MRYRILVVDDSATIRATVAALVDSVLVDVEIVEAPDGRIGLEEIRAGRFDLIITDLDMPEMDGFALIEGARRTQYAENTPIIVLTSRVEDAVIDRAFSAGANGFLNKPIIATEVEESIRRQIR